MGDTEYVPEGEDPVLAFINAGHGAAEADALAGGIPDQGPYRLTSPRPW